MEQPQVWQEIEQISPHTSLRLQTAIENVVDRLPLQIYFVDDANALCPLCELPVPFDSLFTSHLPEKHPGGYAMVDESEISTPPMIVAEGSKLVEEEEATQLPEQAGQTVW